MAKRSYKNPKPKATAWADAGNFSTRKAATRLGDTGDPKKDFAYFTAYKATSKTSIKDVASLVGGEKNVIKFALMGYNNKQQFNLRQGDAQKTKIAAKASEAFGTDVSVDELAEALRVIREKKAKTA